MMAITEVEDVPHVRCRGLRGYQMSIRERPRHERMVLLQMTQSSFESSD